MKITKYGVIEIGKTQTPYTCFAKLFCTYDASRKMLRLGRVCWARGKPGFPGGYTAKLSLALLPMLISFTRERNEWVAVLCGVRVHYQRSFGGWHA